MNDPKGVGKGIHPGRVVWVHDPDATDWDGTTGYWRDNGNTDPVVVDEMMSKAVRWLTGENTDAAAWDAIFKHFNETRGNGPNGYVAGEKIAIKLNFVATGSPDANGYQTRYLEYNGNAKEMIHALLEQLIDVAGVPQADISIGDPTNMFSGEFYDYLHVDYPDVHYMTKIPLPGRETVQFSTAEMNWSHPDAAGKAQDYFTRYYAEAKYFINSAIFKAHWAGITQCAKNHYGSMTRRPDATAPENGGYFAMHDSLAYLEPNDHSYRALVDLMGHEDGGGKTVLYLQDALWGGYGWGGVCPPQIFRSAPFNGDYPSSILMSQDPVAIDSVGFDLWWEEDKVSWNYIPFSTSGREHFPHLAGGCDYLQEGAEADNPPSGTFYDPEGDGTRLASLGVHEHRNADGLYSRNLGRDEGIELITESPVPPVAVTGRHVFYNNSAFDGNDPAANASDDAAVATDKAPLAGDVVTATFANYTSYGLGINGVMVDISNMPGSPAAAG